MFESDVELTFRELKHILKEEQIGEIQRMEKEDCSNYLRHKYRAHFKNFYLNQYTENLLYNIENNPSHHHTITFYFDSIRHTFRVGFASDHNVEVEYAKENKQYAYLHITNNNYQKVQRLIHHTGSKTDSNDDEKNKTYFINMTFTEPIVVSCNRKVYHEIMKKIDCDEDDE